MSEYKPSDFSRSKREEGGAVKYWFWQKKGDILISLVNNEPQPEVRISGQIKGKWRSLTIPMSKSVYETISAKEVLSKSIYKMNQLY